MARVPSYRLHKPSGRAVCTINGKDHYLGKHNSAESKSAYKRLVQEWKTSKCATSFGVTHGITVAMLCADYLEHCESHYPLDKHNSETNQTRYAIRYMRPYLSLEAKEFGPLRLKAVRESMLEAVNETTGRPSSRQYVNKMVDRLVRMFRWAVENELVESPIYEALRVVKGLQKGRTTAPEAKPIKPVADEVVDATVKHCTPVVKAMILLQQLTGMRPGEVCAITPGMIDRSEAVWVATLPTHKSAWRGKDRAIYFGPKGQEIILPYLLRAADSPLFSPEEAERQRRERLRGLRKTPLSCGNRAGTNRKAKPSTAPTSQYSTASYSNAIRYACAKAYPLPEDCTKVEAAEWRASYWWTPNRLRHSAATRIRKAHGLEGAQVMLGHSRMDVTQIYAEVNREKGVEIAALIG